MKTQIKHTITLTQREVSEAISRYIDERLAAELSVPEAPTCLVVAPNHGRHSYYEIEAFWFTGDDDQGDDND